MKMTPEQANAEIDRRNRANQRATNARRRDDAARLRRAKKMQSTMITIGSWRVWNAPRLAGGTWVASNFPRKLFAKTRGEILAKVAMAILDTTEVA